MVKERQATNEPRPIALYTVVSRGAGPIELPLDRLQELPPILVRATLIRLWKHNGWPTSGMTFEHWQQINQAIKSCDKATKSIPTIRNLPGNIRLEIGVRTLKLDVQR